MLEPRPQPLRARNHSAEDLLDAAVQHRSGRSSQLAANDNHLACDVGLWAELDISQDGDGIATNSAIDVNIAEHGNDSLTHGAGDACIAKNGNHLAAYI